MKKIQSLLFIALFLPACQTEFEDVTGLESITGAPDGNPGIVVFSYTVDKHHCEASILVRGKTTEGKEHIQTIKSGRWIYAPGSYMLARLPAGQYNIAHINCKGAYNVVSLGSLARFSVGAGQVYDIGVLDIRKVDCGFLCSKRSVKIERTVRPFKEAELAEFRRRYPDLAEVMVSRPMTTAADPEAMKKLAERLKDLSEKLKEKAEENAAEE